MYVAIFCCINVLSIYVTTQSMRGSRKFFQRGSNFDVFLVDEWMQIALISGHQRPPAKRHLNGVLLAGQ